VGATRPPSPACLAGLPCPPAFIVFDVSLSPQARASFAVKGAQSDGDLPPNDWGDEKAHTRDPTPTTIDPNDPKSKQTHIPEGESFAEYMARRAKEAK